jgi:hypothetical protein
MEELLCKIEFQKDGNIIVAKLQTDMGGLRVYKGPTFEQVLSEVMLELQDEFENVA